MTADALLWCEPTATVALGADEVHVWRVHLDDPRWTLDELAATLSPDEQVRARRLATPQLRRRFVVSRGILRMLLGCYGGSAPHAVSFAYGPHGQPQLLEPATSPALRFSLTRSQALALYAFTRSRRLGVDVEAVRHLPEAAGVADLCFSPRERAALAALHPDDTDEALLTGWTVKEAYAKAVGDGLARPLAGIEVGLAPPDAGVLHAVDGDPAASDRWTLHGLVPFTGYVGALIVEGPNVRQRGWALEPDAPIWSSTAH